MEQDITGKGRVDEMTKPKLDQSERKEYDFTVICDNIVYTKNIEEGQLSGLYYLILWQSYPEEENSWKIISVILHSCKYIKLFYI